MIMMN